MWLLSLLPSGFILFVVNTILIVGVLGFLASWFFGYVVQRLPQLMPYRMAIQIASIILLVLGVYLKGGYSVEMQWRERVAELEAKVVKAEADSKLANVEIQEKIVERVKIVHDTKVVVQEKIRDVQVTIDAQCKVHPKVIDILNEAAANPGAKK